MTVGASNRQATPLAVVLALAAVAATVVPLCTGRPWLSLVPGAAIFCVLALTRRPQLAFYAIVFLIPFGSYRQLSGLGNVKLHWLLALFLVAVVAFKALAAKRMPPQARSNLWPWFLAFGAVSLISALLSAYPATAFKDTALLAVAGMFTGLAMIFTRRHDFVRVIPVIVAVSVSIGSVLAFLGYFYDLSLFAEEVTRFKRAQGATTNPNVLSLTILFVMPFLVLLFFRTRSVWGRLVVLAMVVANLMGMVTTYSRGGALTLGLMVVFLAFVHRRRLIPRNLGFALGLAAVTVIVVAVSVPPEYWARQRSVTDTQEKAVGRRASYLVVGLHSFLRSPVWGHGPGVFEEIYAGTEYARRFAKTQEELKRYAHNTYVEVLVGTGVVGLFLFLGIIWRATRNFTLAARAFEARGDPEAAAMARTYRFAMLFALLYLVLLSDVYQKYVLLCLGLSQAGMYLSGADGRSGDDGPGAGGPS